MASVIHLITNHINSDETEHTSHSLLPQFISCTVSNNIMVPNSQTGTGYHKWMLLNLK